MPQNRHTRKGRSYEEYLDRVAASCDARFHLEASWVVFAMLEDRLNSILRLTGGIPVDRKGQPIRMLGRKLEHVRDRLTSDPQLRKATSAGADLKALAVWKDRRDSLMHSMANDGRPWADLAAEASSLAVEGRGVLSAISAAVMRLKRHKRS